MTNTIGNSDGQKAFFGCFAINPIFPDGPDMEELICKCVPQLKSSVWRCQSNKSLLAIQVHACCLSMNFRYRVIQKKLFLKRELLEKWDFLHCVQQPKIWSPIAPKKIDFFCQFCSDFFGKKNSNIIWKTFDPLVELDVY